MKNVALNIDLRKRDLTLLDNKKVIQWYYNISKEDYLVEKKITFAVKGLIFKDNKFLIVKRNNCNPDVWELPGGHLEYGESAEDTIIREMKEETGLTVKPLNLMDTWDSYLPGRQITGIIYRCESDNFDIRLSDEHCDYRWIAKGEDDFEILHPVFKDKIKKWDWEKIPD